MADDLSIQSKQTYLYDKVSIFLEKVKDKQSNNDVLIELLTNIKENLDNLSIKDLEDAVSDSEDNINDYISSRIQPLQEYIAKLKSFEDNYTEDDKEELELILSNYISLSNIYIQKVEDTNNPNNSFFSKRRIKELKETLSNLESKLYSTSDENKIKVYSTDITFIRNEILKKEVFFDNQVKLEYELKTEKEKKDSYKVRVENAIKTLDSNSSFLKRHNFYLNTIKWTFLLLSIISFIISFIFFIGNIYNLYYQYPYILLAEWKISNYFIVSISIMFPSIFGLIFLKQAHIKSNEIYKISKRFVLIEEVIRALKALIDVSEMKNLNLKVEEIIDRLIDNILNYTTINEDSEKSSLTENQLLELNTKIDSLVDTFEKKLTLLNIPKND